MPYIGKQLVRGQNRELDDISSSFNGSNTVFNLTVAGDSITPGSALQLFISVGGVLQNPNTDFTVAGNQITFTTAPGSGLSFFGILQGDAVDFNTPADGSVTTAKLGSNLTINVADGTAGTPSIQFNGSGTDTGFYSPTTDEIGASVAGGEALRIDSSGRLLVGTSTARANFFNNATSFESTVQVEGIDYNTSSLSITTNQDNTNPSWFVFGKTRGTSVGGNTVVQTNDAMGGISFQGSDGSELVEAARIQAEIDGTPGANDMPGRLVFSTTADGASSPAARLIIKEGGDVVIPATSATKGLWIGTGDAAGNSASANYRIGQNSNGAGSGTLYIGNAAIQVSSDARLKENIQNTTLSAIEELQKVRIVDFTWNDPSDTSYNNRNARGTWTGIIAQELVSIFPFAVNAPRKEDDLSIDHDSDSTWTVEQQQLVPVLIKAIQEQQVVIADLQSRVTALEAQ